MKVLFASLFLSLLSPAITSSILPRADTPQFYLFTSSKNAANLLPVRISTTGSGFTSLTGSAPPGKFFFLKGKLVAAQAGPNPLNGVISAIQLPACDSNWGQLTFLSNPGICTHTVNFQLRSNTLNSQLGAFLLIDNSGGFFACGSTFDIYYRPDNTTPPNLNCVPVSLYTVPVT